MNNTNETKNKYTAFQQWFVTFCEEKQIDMSEPVPCSNGQLQIGDVCSVIMSCPKNEQKSIKDTLVKIDFVNGSVYNYFKHLAQALTTDHKAELSF